MDELIPRLIQWSDPLILLFTLHTWHICMHARWLALEEMLFKCCRSVLVEISSGHAGWLVVSNSACFYSSLALDIQNAPVMQ